MGLTQRFVAIVAARTVAVLALCLPGVMRAQPDGSGPVIGRLTGVPCPDNQSVFAPKKKNDDSVFADDCVLVFTHPDKNEGNEGNDAVMRLDGSSVELHVVKKTASRRNVHYEFADKPGKLKVIMDAKEVCLEGVEGCDFTGSLTIESSRGQARIRIAYYRGA
jgi:hypothetical protein